MRIISGFIRLGLVLLGLVLSLGAFGQGEEEEGLNIDSLKVVYEELEEDMEDYFNQKKYNEAIPIAEELVTLSLLIYGNDHSNYGESLNNFGLLNLLINRPEVALPSLQKGTEILKISLGENDEKYLGSLENVGKAYYEIGEYEKALPYFKLSLEKTIINLGRETPRFRQRRETLINNYFRLKQIDDAESLLENEVKTIAYDYGNNNIIYAETIFDLASFYFKIGKYNEALPILQNADKEYSDSLKTNNKLYVNNDLYGRFINKLGQTYNALSRYEESITCYKRVLKIVELSEGNKSANYAIIQHNVAQSYISMDKFSSAAFYMEKALNALGNKHPDYFILLNTSASLDQELGQYEKAEKKFLTVISFLKESPEKKHFLGIMLSNLALLYEETGKFEKALPLYLEAINASLVSFSPDHIEHVKLQVNLATLLSRMGRSEEAIQILEKNLTIIENTVGITHGLYALLLDRMCVFSMTGEDFTTAIRYCEESVEKNKNKNNLTTATSLNNLAMVYQRTDKVNEANSLLLKSLEICKLVHKTAHPDIAIRLNNLGVVNKLLNRNNEALQYLLSSLSMTEQTIGKENREFGIRANNIALQYERIDDIPNSEQYSNIAYDNAINLTKNQISFTAESIQKDWLLRLKGFSWASQSLKLRHPSYFLKNSTNKLLYFHFLLQNFQLSSKKHLLQAIKTADPETQTKHQTWLKHKNYLARQLALPIANRNADIDSITQVAENLENEIALKSKEFATARKSIALEDVQNKLKADEAFLQFSHFKYHNKAHKWTDSTLYVAYLVHADKEPEMVYLFEQKQLDSLLASGPVLGVRGTADKVIPKRKGSYFDLIWKPLLPHLEGINTLYVNPSGSLHKFNLGAIPMDSTRLVADLFKINYISSARNFVLPQEKEYANTALVLGGLDYSNMHIDTTIAYRSNPLTIDFSKFDFDSTFQFKEKAFGYLKGTQIEATTISNILRTKFDHVNTLTDKRGTEMAIKHIGADSLASPRVLHIATHGFALPNPEVKKNNTNFGQGQNAYRLSEDPLIRTGLILSGGNPAWLGKPTSEGQEDGILTAYEIANLDLSDTELVVLSACDTGLGDIQGTEGVYGLQRGFKMAGVQYIIMSLEAVPDAETEELMVLFYTKWLEKEMSIPAAFRAAQGEMRERYAGEVRKWAGFVLVE